jgi:hypothetical protein
VLICKSNNHCLISLISKYHKTMEFLGPESCITHSPMFESGICKIIGNEELNLDEVQGPADNG